MNGSSQVTDTMLEEDVHIDQKYLDKQSRTIGTYGLETMTKLISFKVLIIGCGGVGVEIAKNLALAGIHTISLHDPRKPEARDIGVNFCINADSLQSGRNMAELSAAYLAELNPNTNIRVVTELTEEGVGHHHALIFTSAAPNISLTTLFQWNQFCRSHTPAISFMFAFQGGTMGSVFVDHGPLFTVKDADGRPMLQKSITEVVTRTDKSGQSYSRIRFETPEGQTPGALRDYTQIKLTEVKGMCKSDGSSVNNNVYQGTVCPCDPPHTVRVYPSFESQGYSAYETGGFVHELKETIQMTFRPLEEALHSPGSFVIVSPMMDGNEESLTHVTLNAFLRYADKHDGRLPPLHNAEAAKEVVELARSVITENRSRYCRMEPLPDQAPEKSEFPTKLPPPPPASPLVTDDLNESHISIQAMIAQAELQPLAAVFGAVVAQEVVKISGKYTPIHQWFHFSCESVLPADVDFTDGEYKLLSSRYDHQIAIFGRRFHEKLQGLKLFMVGCGALGCENIKNFALCGISCGQGGSIVVTDNDRIEISNLSRQFLFREDNVGQSKSVAATRRMLQMNPDANPDARQDFIGPTTEHLFPDTFWSGLDVVVNALDNMEARLYVDQMCVRFNKVLIEAGTMGTGGNVDIVVPGSTTSYADGGAADQTGGIPMCTLRNFPYMYDHCIEWARSLFDDLFVAPMQAAIQIIENPSRFREKIEKDIAGAVSTGEKRSLIQKHLGPLRGLQRTLQILADGPNLQKCVELGWDGLFKIFRDRIYDLQAAFPHDAKKKNGDPFWSGNRKFPSALEATAETVCKSPDIQNYLISAINLYACMFGIHPAKPDARFNDDKHRWMGQYRTLEWLQNAVQGLNVPKYVAGAVGDLDEDLAPSSQNGKETTVEEDAQELSGLLTSLMDLSARCSGATAAPLEFEKDDDDNFQMDYIAAASNLRATNYVIPTEDRMKVKLVAGKIIPAIATTTSVVTGLALLELFKVLQGKDVSTLRNGMVDIGTNNYVLFERDAPHTHRHRIVTTYFPEQDYTYRKKIVCIPEGFTKYDTIPIPVTPKTTVLEFTEMAIKSLNKRLPEGAQYSCEVDGIGVGKGMIWNGSKKHANTERPIMDVIEQQRVSEMETPPPHGFWHNRLHFYDLSVTVSVDDEDDSVDEIDVETAVIRLDITE